MGDHARPLRVDQVAEKLGIAGWTVRKLCGEGAFPGAGRVRPGNPKSAWRIPRAAVEAYQRRQDTGR